MGWIFGSPKWGRITGTSPVTMATWSGVGMRRGRTRHWSWSLKALEVSKTPPVDFWIQNHPRLSKGHVKIFPLEILEHGVKSRNFGWIMLILYTACSNCRGTQLHPALWDVNCARLHVQHDATRPGLWPFALQSPWGVPQNRWVMMENPPQKKNLI